MRLSLSILLLLAAFFILPLTPTVYSTASPTASPQSSPPQPLLISDLNQATFTRQMDTLFNAQMNLRRRYGQTGIIGVYIKELNTGYEYYAIKDLREDLPLDIDFECASTVKLLAAFSLYYSDYQGEIDVQNKVYDSLLNYSGVIEATITRMLTHSINQYYNLFLRFQGSTKMNENLRLAGLTNTNVRREIMPSPEVTPAGNFARHGTRLPNTSTPRDFGILLELLYRGEFIGERNAVKLFDTIQKTIYNSRIPTGIKFEVPVAHKTGTAPGVVNDQALVLLPENPYIISIMSKDTYAGLTDFHRRLAANVHQVMKERAKQQTTPQWIERERLVEYPRM